MTKSIRLITVTTTIGLAVATFSPVTAFAAWWNPFTWGSAKTQSENSESTGISTGISVSRIAPPTVEELQQRITDLEQRLADALAQVSQLTADAQKSVVAKIPAPADSTTQTKNTVSSSEIMAKVTPAMVSVQTATSSGTGTIIDSQGNVLVDAHTIWTQNKSGVVVGAADQISVTLSNGTKKSAILVGIDEAHDVAIIKIIGTAPTNYLKINYDSGLSTGDTVFVASRPSLNGGSTGGSGFVTGTITKKTSGSIEMTTDKKPYDTGGAMITAHGNFIGIPNRSNCKVLEDMSNCLKYTVTENNIRTVVPKLLAGMQLYKQRYGETAEEILVKGMLDGMYNAVKNGSVIDFAINNATGNNSFDYFNSKLGQDLDGKIAKLYVVKLKQIADSIYQAVDFLKSQSKNLDIFFINESAAFKDLGVYEQKVIAQFRVFNAAKLKEYQAKVDLWSRKRNEYDGYITTPQKVTHDYLLEQGSIEESEIDYLTKERQQIIEMFSGDNVNIF